MKNIPRRVFETFSASYDYDQDTLGEFIKGLLALQEEFGSKAIVGYDQAYEGDTSFRIITQRVESDEEYAARLLMIENELARLATWVSGNQCNLDFNYLSKDKYHSENTND